MIRLVHAAVLALALAVPSAEALPIAAGAAQFPRTQLVDEPPVVLAATAAQARAQCRRQYGKRYRGARVSRGRVICSFSKTGRQLDREARSRCAKRFGKRLVRTVRKGTRFTCFYR